MKALVGCAGFGGVDIVLRAFGFDVTGWVVSGGVDKPGVGAIASQIKKAVR